MPDRKAPPGAAAASAEGSGRESGSRAGRHFYKVSGGGNDFIALPEPAPPDPDGQLEPPAPEQVRAWCRRGLSIGADGLFALTHDAPGRVTMRHWNADGSLAELCLNGTRCAARLAFELGWARDEVTIETGAGPVRASATSDPAAPIRLELPPPAEIPRRIRAELEDGAEAPERSESGVGVGSPAPDDSRAEGGPEAPEPGGSVEGWLLTVGVPHLVIDRPDGLADAPVETLGAALVHHPAVGPAGANVDFVHLPAPDRLEIRTYERGVDAETLACGSGVMAAAAVLVHQRRATLPLRALTRGGFELVVDGTLADSPGSPPQITRWSLSGDARLVARGHLLPGATALPETPRWSEP